MLLLGPASLEPIYLCFATQIFESRSVRSDFLGIVDAAYCLFLVILILLSGSGYESSIDHGCSLFSPRFSPGTAHAAALA